MTNSGILGVRCLLSYALRRVLVPEVLGYGNWYEAKAWALTIGAKASYITGFNAPLEKKTYPGFDFLNMGSDDRKLKEIKNGHLTMVAFSSSLSMRPPQKRTHCCSHRASRLPVYHQIHH